MPNAIRIKRRAVGGAAGAPAGLENAELAYNEADDVLYYGKGTGGAGGSATSVIPIAGPGAFAPLASPALSGTPTAPNPAADTDTSQLATTAFVVGQAATATPLMAGTAAVGISKRFARQDHRHPIDTTRAPLASPALTGTPTAPTASGATNNTQIATTAFVQTAVAVRAPLASPALTGIPTAPTAATTTNTTQLATTAFVKAVVAELVGGAGAALDTLDELAAALGDDPNFVTTVTTLIGEKLAKASNLADLPNVATARTNLGLLSMALQAANNVAITGGSINGINLDGGTF